MPSVDNRKNAGIAKKRMEDKYIMVKDHQHPFNMFPPNKDDTKKFQEMMNTRNYIRIQTQMDDCKYIVMQYYIYTEADIWVCGDAMVFNNNPDKKIWCKYMCTATRGECICEEESTKSFITVCPTCKNVVMAIKDTPFECKYCKMVIDHISINRLPYARLSCAMCPKVISWANVQAIKELVFEKLVNRSKEMSKFQTILDDQNG